jgi:hypothetical protein
MAKYKIEGISLNGGEDAKKNKGKLKGDLKFTFDTNLESLSLEGLFETNPVVKKQPRKDIPIEVDLKKRNKKKKRNELF